MAARKHRNLKLQRMTFREETSTEGMRIGRFSGYLAVYGNRDSYDSCLVKGAFAKSVAEHDSFPLLADHDSTAVIGKFKATEDDFGLRIDAEVLLDIERAMEKWIALKALAIDGLSVGFSVIREEYDSTLKLLKILEARLWEGSVVTFPANELALGDEIRAMQTETRSLVEPLGEIAQEITESVKLMGRAVEKDEKAKARTLDLLDRASERIEALRANLDGAAETTTEPLDGHSDETSEADKVELSATLQRISNLFPAAAAA